MECADTVQLSNHAENYYPYQDMEILHHIERTVENLSVEENQDSRQSENGDKNQSKGISDADVSDEDSSQQQHSGRQKMVILSNDESSSTTHTPAVNGPLLSDEEDKISQANKKKRVMMLDSDSDEDTDLLFMRKPDTQQPKVPFKYNSDLFDTELSDEDDALGSGRHSHSPSRQQDSGLELDNEKPNKGENKKEEKRKPKSVKKAQQELKEIHSESQRLVRESQVSLPYHRPKQRTLAEFLERRKKTLPKKPQNQSLKMSMRNLETLRLLEEKKNQVEEFFKSDSDSEDPEDLDWTPANEDTKKQQRPHTEVLCSDGDFKDHNDAPVEFNGAFPGIDGAPTDHNDASTELNGALSNPDGANTDLDAPKDHNGALPNLNGEATDPDVDSALPDISCGSSSFPAPLGDVSPKDHNGALPDCNGKAIHPDVDSALPDISCSSSSLPTPLGDACTQAGLDSQGGSSKSLPSNGEMNENAGRGSLDSCEENVHSNASSPLEMSDSRVSVDKQHREGNLIELTDSVDEKEDEIEFFKEVTIGASKNENQRMRKEPLTVYKEESGHSDTQSSTGVAKLSTPKLNLLASRLPQEDLKKIMSATPKLGSGRKDQFIDLGEEVTPERESGITDLISRFMKHSSAKKPTEKQHMTLNIVRKEDDGQGRKQLVSSSVMVTVGDEGDQVSESVPGSCRASLKATLQARIRQQREHQRLKRVQEKQFMETEQVIQDYSDEDLPNEEAELTDLSETDYETESEPEENDILIIDKEEKKKSWYVDDEAEEDDSAQEYDEGGKDEEEPGDEESDEETGTVLESENTTDTVKSVKEQRQNTKDLDEEESENLKLDWEETQELPSLNEPLVSTHSNADDLFPSQTFKKGDNLEKDTSTTSFDSSFELYGSMIAGHQPGGGTRNSSEGGLPQALSRSKSSCSSINTKRQCDSSLPVEDSLDIFNTEATSDSPGRLDLHLSLLQDLQHPQDSDKENSCLPKLQLDFSRIGDTQNKDDLLGLCSGQFTEKTQMRELSEQQVSSTQEMNELLGLCSGHFAKSQLSGALNSSTFPVSQDDPDDELLGLCTAKFTMAAVSMEDSQAASSEAVKNVREDPSQSEAPEMIVFSSDDETLSNVNIKARKLKRKKRKRVLEFSDDEDAQQPIMFDDEENEVPRTVFTGFKDKEKGGIRADFLENEAELSGSDENSDDEVEGSDDDMEEEEGDIEQFDANELRNQVGKAHLKSLLDSDKREVRLLQELYLEDGELHGQGRNRQFRWKNADKNIVDEERRTLSDGEEKNEDDGDESEWRKQKVEREQFLQEHKTKMGIDAELYSLDCFPVLHSTRSQDSTSITKQFLYTAESCPPKTTSSVPIRRLKKMGSFLGRDKATLARIADFTKDKSVVGGANQGGNFVFQQLSSEEVQKKESDQDNPRHKKRHSLPTMKKARVDRSFLNSDDSSSIFKFF